MRAQAEYVPPNHALCTRHCHFIGPFSAELALVVRLELTQGVCISVVAPSLSRAARALSCNVQGLSSINDQDPLNPGNSLSGYMCKDEGALFGTMYISAVNGTPLARPSIIYGVPSINEIHKAGGQNNNNWRSNRNGPKGGANSSSSPSSSAPSSSASMDTDAPAPSSNPTAPSTESTNPNPWARIEPTSRVFIANKWNGINLTVFKYQDTKGQTFVSVMPRGQAFLRGEIFESLCTLLQIAVDSRRTAAQSSATAQLNKVFPLLSQPEVQSVTYELIGKQFAQLVAYDFDNKLQPLFATTFDGTLIPQALLSASVIPVKDGEDPTSLLAEDAAVLSGEFGPFDFDPSLLGSFSKTYRARSLELNRKFRESRGLKDGYRTENFAAEGKVVFLLNDFNGTVSRSSLYKIKPSDISKSHIEFLDVGMQTQMFEALEKIYSRGLALSPALMKSEMEMSDRLWGRIGGEIMNIVTNRPNFSRAADRKTPKMLVVMGLPGSGKSTIANKLAKVGWTRVNQDEMGNRKAVEASAKTAFAKGLNVVVDRCNIDFEQRVHFLELAARAGVTDIRCLWLDTPAQVCKDRVSVRKDHPTIPQGDFGHGIIDKFTSFLVPPMRGEGFCEIIRTCTEAEVDQALEKFALLAQTP